MYFLPYNLYFQNAWTNTIGFNRIFMCLYLDVPIEAVREKLVDSVQCGQNRSITLDIGDLWWSTRYRNISIKKKVD